WNIFGDHAVFFQGVFALHESGTLEDETYHAYLDWFASHAATPGGSVVWKQFHLIMPRRMVEAVDERLASEGLLELGELPPFRIDGFQPPTSGENRGST
ncbi:MAG: hypothetical protein OER77_17150, partial [Myxococcales bacterium]|nr:hypothetical protein [Myxococcales bacterium]